METFYLNQRNYFLYIFQFIANFTVKKNYYLDVKKNELFSVNQRHVFHYGCLDENLVWLKEWHLRVYRANTATPAITKLFKLFS